MSIRLIVSTFIFVCIYELCEGQCERNFEERFDCVPDLSTENKTVLKDICTQRKCCYNDVANESIPVCFYPSGYTNYVVIKEWKSKTSLKLLLLAKTALPVWPVDQRITLVVIIDYINVKVVRVTIQKPNDLDAYTGDEILESNFRRSKLSNKEYEVLVNKNPFSFSVIRKSTNAIIFNTSVSDIIYGTRFKQISSKIGEANSCIYGLAEHTTDLCIPTNERKLYTLFNRGDQPQEKNDTRFNLYGFHPFYLAMEKDGNAHGVYFHNTNAMDIVVQPGSTITYRTVGGHLDFFFLLGPQPDDVTTQYTSIVGRPFLPPYWALGFHLCRYDYNSTEITRKTWKRTVDAGIPLDVQWNDIDFMDNYKDFTYDPIKYKGLPDFIKELHDAN
ncbi:Lysosomal alpha-glucosidase-like protein, partial [Leptotrombidium deliense]